MHTPLFNKARFLQLVHWLDDGPKQVAQLKWHAALTQLPWLSGWKLALQTQVPPDRNAFYLQLVHTLKELHVAQMLLQVAQLFVESRKKPPRHRHWNELRKKLLLHVIHWLMLGPEHVAQVGWHVTETQLPLLSN